MPINTISKKPLLILFAVFLPLYLTWTFDHGLWNPDETRDAGIAREMYVHKEFAVPHLNGEAFLEKPPLYYWSCAAVYAVTGRITAGTTRLPAALYGFLGLLFTFLIGRRFFNDTTALAAAAMLGISVQYFRMSHFALMDTALAATVTGALYFYASGSILLYLLFTALAFYAKGFLGVVLVGAVIGVDLLLERNWKKILWLAPLSALVLAAFIAPWIYALWKSGGTTYLKIFFVDNHLHRFASTLDHKHPFYYYLGTFPADFLPWSPLFLAALYQFLRARGWASDHRGVALCVRWFAAIFILLSIATSKRSMYMMPLTPAAALLTAHWVLEKKILSEKILVRAFAVLILLVVAADAALIRRLDADKSFVPFVNVVKDMRGGRELIAYDLSEMESGVFPFYFEQRIPNFKTPEEMQAYLSQNPNKSLVLITNRNKFDLINPVLEKRLKVIHRFRPDQKTRSYLLYSTPS